MGKNRKLSLALIAGLLGTMASVSGCVPTETTEEGGVSILPLVIFLVVIFGLMYFVTFRSQRKRQKDHQHLVEELRRGDKVITAGGIYGQVDSVSDESVVLKVDPGTTIRIAKNSISGKQLEEKSPFL